MHGTHRKDSFVDYYEYLQISPNADFETIEKVYRLLAKRYHPDNGETGDADKFRILTEAYHALTDPEQRAGYDAKYEAALARQWKIMDETSAPDNFDTDSSIRRSILSLLYRTRRQDTLNPGIGIYDLQRMLNCPENHMEFHMWYLKEKGFIQRTENGMFAITADGVDSVAENDIMFGKDRLLPTTDDSVSKSE